MRQAQEASSCATANFQIRSSGDGQQLIRVQGAPNPYSTKQQPGHKLPLLQANVKA